MLNSVSLMGRLVSEPVIQTIKKEEKELTIARYRLAVERDYKEGEQRPVDFIVCKVFGTDALFAQKYFKKGDTVAVTGRIFSEPYKKEGIDQGFFTGVLVHKNYLAKRTDDTARRREMTIQQDGEKKGMEEGLDLPELPPLPEEEFADYGMEFPQI